MLESEVAMDALQELEKASALVEAPNIEKRPDTGKPEKMPTGHRKITERNKQIVKAYRQGYSQHMIAKVLGISQPAVHGVMKRNGK
jgi:DNA-binding NarL/FixJ family response regulator